MTPSQLFYPTAEYVAERLDVLQPAGLIFLRLGGRQNKQGRGPSYLTLAQKAQRASGVKCEEASLRRHCAI